ncbi:fungal-specific transcription factor domain-containing protein [Cerioporus squamosus]|nr:fungal-specific transcription factor domain-containing protein [Cerioporus squamosus]
MPSGKGAPEQRDPVDRSDDESPGAGVSGQGKTQRISKACDKCRKHKSKCEPSPTDGEPCKTCAASGSVCTYTAPSFRRGPPKGYIQALEHRLHQVESVLAGIMSSADPRAQSIIEELRQDELAAYILDSVDAGPFGRTGREKRAIDTSKDNFFSSIVTAQPKTLSHRSRRQSRATRENVIESVIASDPQIQTTRPTLAWQDKLSARLVHTLSSGSRTLSQSGSQSPRTAMSPSEFSADDLDFEPPRTKRRLEGPSRLILTARPGVVSAPASSSTTMSTHPYSRQMSAATNDLEGDDLGDCADAFGNLSIDENREVRYHGNSAGLQLLAQTERTDERNSKGIWMFPMAKYWPGPGVVLVEHARAIEQSIPLPPIEVQDLLIRVYFTYVNPAVPVIDEESFMLQYNAQRYGLQDPEEDAHAAQNTNDVRPERPQRLSKLLLLAMFAYAATHLDPTEMAGSDVEDAANEYARRARVILDAVYHESRSATVQALILLGIREFGIASLEEGWLHIGMATRMALDLGLNRNPDKWMHNGRELFTEKEKAIRKRIWWSCCLADKFSALFLGRTIGIHEGDFSTPLLDIPADDADKMWQPCPPDPLCGRVTPVPANYTGYFHHISSLFVITGEVLAKIYRVSRATAVPSRALRAQMHQRLQQWHLDLPEHLDYSLKSNRPCPAPHILAMHIQYWATMILTHRPFIPKGSDLASRSSPSLDPDPLPWESYDICQSAASQVASFALLYHEKYNMRWAPPFLSNCIQAAGVMSVVVLRYKPLDTQASVGLTKCIGALAGMELTWTSALRVRHLIQNAQVLIDNTYAGTAALSGDNLRQQKRRAQIAFEQDIDLLYSGHAGSATHAPPLPLPRRQLHTLPEHPHHRPQHHAPARSHTHTHTQTHTQTHTHTHAQVHASPPYDSPTEVVPAPLDTSQAFHPGMRTGADAGTGGFVRYMPGYDSWWPVLDQQQQQPQTESQVPVPVEMQVPSADEFTFSPQQFSPDFLQAMRDPVIHFPSAFVHQY